MAETTTAAPQHLLSTPVTTAPPSQSTTVPTPTKSEQLLRPASPRKRGRSPEPPATPYAGRSFGKSPPPVSPKNTTSSLLSTVRQLTAAAEMSEQKRRKLEHEMSVSQQTSPNPQTQALGALLGAQNNAMSGLQDAPSTAVNTLSAPLAAIAPTITIPDKAQTGGSIQTSPVSTSSMGIVESTGTAALTASAPQVDSPGQMIDDDEQAPPHQSHRQRADTGDSQSNKAFTYPGPLLSAQVDSRRGMSLPGSGLQREDSRSPGSNKKHKCPYCSTEFTRHHNLKSHLLTHSHEKPYLCQTCDHRFRRLHDLKRHTKLHTGERPHICPKCKRSFARGDALARHNKGQGGCATRRSSVGSFGEGGPDDSMDGMIYTNETSHEPEAMDEDNEGIEERGTTLPTIRHHHDAPSNQPGQAYRSETQPSSYQQRQPSTYPPVAAPRAPMSASLFPPGNQHSTSNNSTSPNPQSTSLPSFSQSTFPSSSSFGPHAMTESPKPLSPGQPHPHPAGDRHNRSPSLSTQLQQSQYNRRTTHNRTSPPPFAPPPAHSNAPHLPNLPGLAPPDNRYTLHSTPANGPTSGGSLPHPQSVGGGSYPGASGGAGSVGGGPGSIVGIHSSASNSLSSHGTNKHSSGDRGTLGLAADDRIWAVIRSMEDKISRLEEEVRSLKGQLVVSQQREWDRDREHGAPSGGSQGGSQGMSQQGQQHPQPPAPMR